MNGMMCGHWGLVTWPDNEFRKNVLVTEGGQFDRLDESAPFEIKSPVNLLARRLSSAERLVRRAVRRVERTTREG